MNLRQEDYESCTLPTELLRNKLKTNIWSERLVSNQRPKRSKRSALPTELLPVIFVRSQECDLKTLTTLFSDIFILSSKPNLIAIIACPQDLEQEVIFPVRDGTR